MTSRNNKLHAFLRSHGFRQASGPSPREKYVKYDGAHIKFVRKVDGEWKALRADFASPGYPTPHGALVYAEVANWGID